MAADGRGEDAAMNARALDGRHALITGAGSGIGAAIARALAECGARITLLARRRKQLEQTAAQLDGVSTTHLACCDVGEESQVEQAVLGARAALGPIQILVNNAGQASSAPFLKTDTALWRLMIATNLTGAYLCSRAVLPDMIEGGFGRIINVASTAGLKGYAYISAYCASKHGLIGLTRALAIELAQCNVTVNAVCPSYTDTEMTRATIDNIRNKTGRSEQDALAALTAQNPQRRLITPAEVACTARWLCLPGSESITGQSIAIAGGEVM